VARSLTFQEALRTLGNGLEAHRSRRAHLVVDADGIEVDAVGEYGHRRYTWDDVATQSRTQQTDRRPRQQPPPWMDPWALTRWSVLLRITGQFLDHQRIEECTIYAVSAPPDQPDACRIGVSVDGALVLDDTAVRGQIATLRMRRGTATKASQRPKWAFWRRG
jgi:hypothetical protein